MSPTTPRKVRSGRRQFGPSPGTEQEWAKVMQSPHVQRAFQDPNIQQALMQHMQQQAASAAPPAQAAPPGMAHGGALHFDTGGSSSAIELQDVMRQIATMPEGPQKDQLRMRAATLQVQQSQQAQPLQIPGGGTVSGSTMGGVNQMVKPPTLGNTALAAGMSGLMGLGATSHQGMSALLGAGLGGALSYLIRKYGKNAQAQKDQQGGGGGYGGGSSGGGGGYTPMPEQQGGATPGGSVNATTGATEVPAAQASDPNWRNTPDKPASPSPSVTLPDTGPPGASPPGPNSLMMGTANSDSGNVISRDGGKTWIDQKTQKPYTDKVVNTTQIDPGSSLQSAAPVTTPPPPAAAPPPPPPAATDTTQQQRLGRGLIPRGPDPQNPLALANLPIRSTAFDPFYGTGGFGLAEGGPVPEAPPSGLRSALSPIPVLHTTIVIAGKPKKADKKTAKKASPQGHEDRPRTHGRVQVPRGSGAAIKGKRFGGIY